MPGRRYSLIVLALASVAVARPIARADANPPCALVLGVVVVAREGAPDRGAGLRATRGLGWPAVADTIRGGPGPSVKGNGRPDLALRLGRDDYALLDFARGPHLPRGLVRGARVSWCGEPATIVYADDDRPEPRFRQTRDLVLANVRMWNDAGKLLALDGDPYLAEAIHAAYDPASAREVLLLAAGVAPEPELRYAPVGPAALLELVNAYLALGPSATERVALAQALLALGYSDAGRVICASMQPSAATTPRPPTP